MKHKSAQNFAVIHQHVLRSKTDNCLSSDSQAFYYVVLACQFELQDNEIDESITDDNYRISRGDSPGRDRGVDAIHIDEGKDPVAIHFFNCKYSGDIGKTESFFPSNEVDKLLAFLAQLMSKDLDLLRDINTGLRGRVKEIWDHIERTNPRFVLHFASNYTEGLTVDEEFRLKNALKLYSNFTHEFHTQSSLAEKIAHRGRVRVAGKCKAIHKNLFEKSAGDIRALIVHVEGGQLVRLLCNDETLRQNANLDMSSVTALNICEDAFEDNVRIYLQGRSKVNRNIKATVLSPENGRFFYFNNGITITCDRFKYPTSQSAPIIELENIQVVNGGQTVHALFEAFNEKPTSIEPVEVLCRIYETTDAELSSRIAERTNSQTPVKTRDIHSIDIGQIKLEAEFKALGLFYERKRNQYGSKPKDKRIDAERCGQVALAFYHQMPLEAKNRKNLIFGDKYEEIFSDTTTAHSLLLPLQLFEKIEEERREKARGQNSWLRYSSYHLLYALRLEANRRAIELAFTNLNLIWKCFIRAKSALRRARKRAKDELGENFEDALFFKSNRATRLIAGELNP